ncbi:MAG: IS4 family transposase, partial [Methylobacter sp.]|nr:IS4 family transposase [Methylobacter sp.]
IIGLNGNRLISALQELLKAMASTAIGRQKRKSQPRAVKRRPKPFPLLTAPRNEAGLRV